MRAIQTHAWDVSPSEAVTIQKELRAQLRTDNCVGKVRTVAGVDVGLRKGIARAAIVVLGYPDLNPLEQATAQRQVEFPYIPGLLTFREGPVILDALAKLTSEPDVLIFDGQGMAHPRRMGLATHIGILLDHPTIGCAKSRLCGEYEEPEASRGAWSPLLRGSEVIGAVVRTRANVSPVYVSIGHRIDLEQAIHYVLNCCRVYRLPETTRWAHRVAGGASIESHRSEIPGR